MKITKTLCAIMAAMVICTVSMAGCSDNSSSSTSGQSNSTAQADAETTKDVAAIADKLKSDITYEDEIIEIDEGKIEKIIGVAKSEYKTAKCYIGSSGATPEEIDCFEANDADSAKAISEALTKRVESQKTVFKDYKPEQMDKLNSPVIVTEGNYVFLCISGDNDKATEIIA